MRTPLLAGLVAFIVLVSVWTPLEYPRIAERWFSWPNLLYLSPVPIVTGAARDRLLARHRRQPSDGGVLQRGGAVRARVRRARDLDVALSRAVVDHAVGRGGGAGIADLPPVGTAVLMPFILGYTVFVYYTFRGKLREGEGYH